MKTKNYKSLDDYYRGEKKNILKKASGMFFNCNIGVLTIYCRDGSKIVLTREDFSSPVQAVTV